MKIEGIVLAAGLSKRAGTYKMELKFGEKTLIEKSIEGMYDLCSRIIVVGGYRIERVISILNKYEKVEVVFNKDYEKGMFSSIKEGMKHVKEEKFFFLPGDYPFIDKKVYKKMLSISGDIIIPTYKEKKGHPVLLKSIFIKEILNECKYATFREFIYHNKPTFVEVDEDGILIDIDTMEDYEANINSGRF